MLSLLGFLAATAFWPAAANAAIAPRFVILSLAIPFLFAESGARLTWFWKVFLAWGAFSLLWTPVLVEGLQTVWILLLWAAIFSIGASMASVRETLLGYAAGMWLNALVAVLQLHGIVLAPEATTPPAGLFVNRDFLAEAAMPALVWALFDRQRWLALGPFLCLALTRPLGCFVGLAASALLWLWHKNQRAALIVGCALALNAPFVLQHHDAQSTSQRVEIWLDTLQNLTPRGSGAGSFYVEYPRFQKRLPTNFRSEYAHNEYLQLVFEFGLVGAGLGAFALVWLARCPYSPEKLALVALVVEATFSFSFHLPATVFASAFLAGRLYRLRHPLRKRVVICVGAPNLGQPIQPDARGDASQLPARGRDFPA